MLGTFPRAVDPSSEKEVVDTSVHLIPTPTPSDEKEVFDVQARLISGPPSSIEQSGSQPTLKPPTTGPTAGIASLPKRGLWTPFFLRREVAFAFVAITLAILAAAEVLNSRSLRDNGLASARLSLHYLWTFGPTAILTILAALWNQLDYQSRRNAPLVRMSRAGLLAQDSILLDYLSPWDPQALIAGINGRNWQVSLSILGALCVRLLIVLSTGLFVLRYPAVPVQIPITLKDDFNFARVNDMISDPGKISSDALGPPVFNIPYNDGTNAQFATQSFGSTNAALGVNATLEADVRVLSADLDCERAEWAYSNSSQTYVDVVEDKGLMNVTFSSDSYVITSYPIDAAASANAPLWNWDMSQSQTSIGTRGAGWIVLYGLTYTACKSKKTGIEEPCYLAAYGYSQKYNYETGTTSPSTSTIADVTRNSALPVPGSAANPTPSVLVGRASSVLIARQVAIEPDGQTTSLNYVGIKEMTSFICRPTVSISRARVRGFDGMNSTARGIKVMSILEQVPPSSVGLSEWDFAEKVRNASLIPGLLSSAFQDENQIRPVFFDTVRTLARKPSSFDYLDPDTFKNATRSAFQALTAQYAKNCLMESRESSSQGRVINIGPRLVIETLTLRLMDGFLVIFALCALTICLFFAFPGLPRDFGSAGALALLFSRSPDLMRLFSGLGSARISHIGAWLHGYRFRTVHSIEDSIPSYRICAKIDTSIPERTTQSPRKEMKWWRPAIFNRPLRTLTVVIPLLLCGGLEAGYRYSGRHQGFSSVPEGGYLKYAWTFLPALVMVATASTFSVLDFATRTFQPYHALSGSRKATAKDLVETPFGHFAVHSLIRSCFRRQWAQSATSLAVCISPLLTIVVSGLLQAGNVPIGQSRSATLSDTFVPETNNRYDFNADSSIGISSLLVYLNVSWPAFTYEKYVFPSFALLPNATDTRPSRLFEIALPGAVIESNCTVVDSTAVTWNASAPVGAPAGARLSGFAWGPMTTNTTTLWDLEGRIDLSSYKRCIDSSNNSQIQSLGFNTSNYDLPSDGAVGSAVNVDAQNVTCDGIQYGYLYAMMRTKGNAVQDLVAVNCKPRVDIVTVNATARTLDYQISNVTLNDDSDSQRRLFSTSYSLFGLIDFPCSEVSWGRRAIRCAVEALTSYSRHRISEDDLFNPATSLQAGQAFTNMMNLLVAQRFSTWHRVPLNRAPTSEIFTAQTTKLEASLLDETQYRIVQDRISTRILQSLLGVMSLCALVAWACTRSNKVLTKNPQSIAAVASLLADSDMLRDIPPGAEFMTDKELRRNGVLEGCLYSIGWWGEDRNRRFGIDMGEAEKPG